MGGNHDLAGLIDESELSRCRIAHAENSKALMKAASKEGLRRNCPLKVFVCIARLPAILLVCHKQEAIMKISLKVPGLFCMQYPPSMVNPQGFACGLGIGPFADRGNSF